MVEEPRRVTNNRLGSDDSPTWCRRWRLNTKQDVRGGERCFIIVKVVLWKSRLKSRTYLCCSVYITIVKADAESGRWAQSIGEQLPYKWKRNLEWELQFIPDRGKRVSPQLGGLSIAVRKRSIVLRIPRLKEHTKKSWELAWNRSRRTLETSTGTNNTPGIETRRRASF